jgi:hypothetical protein
MQQHTWQGSSSYAPIRTMYECGDGVIKPVIDLEPHYEATHHAFNVSDLVINAHSSWKLPSGVRRIFGTVLIRPFLLGKSKKVTC